MTKRVRKVFEDHTRGELSKVPCLGCRASTQHRVIASRNIETQWDSEISERDDYEVLECSDCQQISLRHRHSDSESFFTDDDGEHEYEDVVALYPPRKLRSTALAPAVELPFPIRNLYLEASAGLDASLTHLVALALSPLLEATFKNQGVTGRSPYHLIEAAIAAGLITATEASVLHKVRELRNAADHEAERPLEESVATAFEIVERLLHRLYVAPNLLDALKRPPTPF